MSFLRSQKIVSFNYPDGWQTKDTDGNTALFKVAPNRSEAVEEGAAGIMFIVTPLGQMQGAKLSTIADVSRIQLKNQFPFTEFELDEEVTISGMQGQMFEFSFAENGVNYVTRYYTLLNDENMIVMLVATNKDMWGEYSGVTSDIVESFTLL